MLSMAIGYLHKLSECQQHRLAQEPTAGGNGHGKNCLCWQPERLHGSKGGCPKALRFQHARVGQKRQSEETHWTLVQV